MMATFANDRLQTPCLIKRSTPWREDPLPLDDGNRPGLADFCRLCPTFPGGNKGSLQVTDWSRAADWGAIAVVA